MSSCKGKENKEFKYVYDIKFSDRQSLCRMLDVSDKWKEIGGAIGYSMDNLNYFELAFRRGGSPTDELLKDWGHKNPTITKFYELLQRQELLREKEVLEKYLPPERCEGNIHDEYNMPSLNSANYNREDLPKPHDFAPPSWTHPASSSFNRNRSLDEHTQDSNCSLNSFSKKPASSLDYPPSQPDIYYRSNSQNKGFLPESVYQKTPSEGQDPTSLQLDTSKPYLPHLDPRQRKEPVESQDYSEVKKEENPESPSQGLQLQRFAAENMIKFEMNEIKTGTTGFHKDMELGSGGFGTVYKCKLNGTYYAVKRLEGDKGCNHSLAEIKALSRYRHENIVQLCGYSYDEKDDQFILVLELLPNGSLEDRINCKNNTAPLTWQQRHSLMLGAAKGVLYLHSTVSDKLLFHGDIKSANILLDANFKAKISDFGLARETKKSNITTTMGTKLQTTCYGSEHYLPAEYKRNGKPSAKVDVHCFGVVLLEVTTGRPPLNEDNKLLKETIEDKYVQGKATPNEFKDKQARDWPDHYWNEMLKLGVDCTVGKAKQRPEMKEVFGKLEELQEEIQKTTMKGKHSEPDLVSNAVNFKSGGGADPSLHGEQPKNGRKESPKLDKQLSYVKTGPCTQESIEEEAWDPKYLKYDSSKMPVNDSNSTDIYSAKPYDYKKLRESEPFQDPENREAVKLQRIYDEKNEIKSKELDTDSSNVVSLHKEARAACCTEDTSPKTIAEHSKTENPDDSIEKGVKNLRIANRASIEEDEIKKKADAKKFPSFLSDASSLNSFSDQSQSREISTERSSDVEQAACSFDDSAVIAKTASKKNYHTFLDTDSVCSSTFDSGSVSSVQRRSTERDAEEIPTQCFNRVDTMGNNSQVNVTAPSRVYSDK